LNARISSPPIVDSSSIAVGLKTGKLNFFFFYFQSDTLKTIKNPLTLRYLSPAILFRKVKNSIEIT